jgi:uncharacterized membrane protein YccC
VRSLNDRRLAAIHWLAGVLPDWLVEAARRLVSLLPYWLVEAVRPAKVPIPRAAMLRAVIAIWVPLAAGIISGDRAVALLPTLGGVISVMLDPGGSFPVRARLVGTAACGGAVGLLIGTLIHGRGVMAVVALTLVAGLSSMISRLGRIGSAAGLQLLLYSTICLGPLGTLRPSWHPALGFIGGAAWGLLILVPSWLRAPRATEVQLVVAVYHDVAKGLRLIGAPGLPAARRELIASVNAAYDAVPTWPTSRAWMRQATHLRVILNASHSMTEAATALRVANERPPPWVCDSIDRLADAISTCPARQELPAIPPLWSSTPGATALRESMVRLSAAIAGEEPSVPLPAGRPALPERLRNWLRNLREQFIGGRLAWTFTIRLMSCMLVASLLSEVLPIQRSYWVPLTVAVILKPDYGSVFVRAVQRAIGTIVGAVVGAAILAVVPFGPWLLAPFGILAALLPWGKAANFGLAATFLAPFVVLLTDLIKQTNWELAADRGIDTVVASLVVLLVGYAPWPTSWHAHLPGKFAETLAQICDYMDEALVPTGPTSGLPSERPPSAPWRSRLRRQCYRTLSDLRVEYQRTMSEPPAISRRVATLWPAVAALEGLLDAVAGTAVAISRGAAAPDPSAVGQLTNELRAIAAALAERRPFPPTSGPLPSDQPLEPVTSATRSLFSILTPVEEMPPELWSKAA